MSSRIGLVMLGGNSMKEITKVVVDAHNLKEVEDAIQDNTRAIYLAAVVLASQLFTVSIFTFITSAISSTLIFFSARE